MSDDDFEPPDRGGEIFLVADLLDRQVVDTEGKLVCKVDDVEFGAGEDGSQHLTGILVGAAALAPRLGGTIESIVMGLRARITGRFEISPGRIDWAVVDHIDTAVHLLVRRGSLGIAPLEDSAREHVIDKLPGAAHESE